MKCPECNKEMSVRDIKGKSFPYKSHKNVVAKESYGIMTCSQCGEMILNGSDCKRLDDILERSLTKQTTDQGRIS